MNAPKTSWRDFYEKNKKTIIICGAIGVGVSLASGNGSDAPVVVGGGAPVVDSGFPTPQGGVPNTDTGIPTRSVEEWNREQDRQQEKHEEFVESVIREEQTCSNGETISIHDTCPSE